MENCSADPTYHKLPACVKRFLHKPVACGVSERSCSEVAAGFRLRRKAAIKGAATLSVSSTADAQAMHYRRGEKSFARHKYRHAGGTDKNLPA